MCLWTRRSNGMQSLRGRVKDGTVLEVRPGMFVRPAYWEALTYAERILHILRTVCARHPNWVLSHISAAAAWGLNATYTMHDCVHVATDEHRRTRDRGCYRFHHLADVQGESRDGMLVTPLLQTVFDCMRTLPFPEALAICDAALREYGVALSDVQAFLAGKQRYKGIGRARIVASYADARSENGGESIARAWLILWGYDLPELQVEFRDPVTGRNRRADFVWPLDNGRMIIGELDGREKYENPIMLGNVDTVDAVLAEKERESNLQLLGGMTGNVVVVRFSFRELIECPDVVRHKLDMVGVPKHAAPGWVGIFPRRAS